MRTRPGNLITVDRHVLRGLAGDAAANLARPDGFVPLRPEVWLPGWHDRQVRLAFRRSLERLERGGLVHVDAANLRRERATHARLTDAGQKVAAEYSIGATDG